MQFVRREGDQLLIENLFNAQHAEQLMKNIQPSFSTISFKNVSIKIMKLILLHFEQVQITRVAVVYNWNDIMVNPKLVCYDKSQWKTLQQLNNWNKEWKELFSNCYYLSAVYLKVECTWMDSQFAQQFLEGVAKVPNIQAVTAEFSSKNKEVEKILSAFDKGQIFSKFQFGFVQLK